MTIQPNALWIYGEDLYPDLACYGTPAVHTPHIDELAAQGTTFQSAFVTCPVSSPSRSAIITGCYQTRIGAHHHRSRRAAPLPEDIPLITDCFRSAGYFTCNSPGPGAYDKVGKTDFNFAVDSPFDDTDDRIRCVRTPGYKYIRNLQPERPYIQFNAYKKHQYPVWTLMRVLHERGQLDRAQRPFMASERPGEELYDLRADPHEVRNVAGDPQHAAALAEHASLLDDWLLQSNDLGLLDEDPHIQTQEDEQMERNFAERMRARGLDPAIGDEDYLTWWMGHFGL